MRPHLAGIGIGLAIAFIGVFASSIPLVVLGVLVGLAIVAFTSMRATRSDAFATDQLDDLSPESRILVRPLKKIFNEMSEGAAGKSETISPYLAQEALRESDQLLRQSVEALLLRDRLAKESRGRYDAEKSIADLESRLATSTSEDEKASLTSALAARKLEIGYYETAKEGISRIESSVKQAEAAMAEMRAKLITSGSVGAAAQGSDPLRETVGRMQALSASLTEAQEMVKGTGL